MRTFIAVDIDEDIKKAVGDIISRLKKGIQFTGAFPSWVPVENMHLTMKFLGEVDEGILPKINESLRGISAEFQPFDITLEKIGVFPNKKAPRVIWIGIKQGKEQLALLQQKIEFEMELLGFTPENREFSPHLTLARIKSMRGVEGMMDVIFSHSNYLAGTCSIKELIIYRSVLQKTGAVYTPLYKIPLKEDKINK